MRPCLALLALAFLVIAALSALPWYWDGTLTSPDAMLAVGTPLLCALAALAATIVTTPLRRRPEPR